MPTINNLADLLMYQLRNLYAAEEQMIQAVELCIEKAHHSSVKNALKHHAGLTAQQKERLTRSATYVREKIPVALLEDGGLLNTEVESKGMRGLLEEVNEVLSTDLASDVNDAAIIACVQKLEHYEICGYGTALAYAKQLNLSKVATLLNETLQEEYDADDLLTALATAAINKEGLPEGLEASNDLEANKQQTADEDNQAEHTTISITHRTIQSPGGRAGTSHRTYKNGESRGH